MKTTRNFCLDRGCERCHQHTFHKLSSRQRETNIQPMRTAKGAHEWNLDRYAQGENFILPCHAFSRLFRCVHACILLLLGVTNCVFLVAARLSLGRVSGGAMPYLTAVNILLDEPDPIVGKSLQLRRKDWSRCATYDGCIPLA